MLRIFAVTISVNELVFHIIGVVGEGSLKLQKIFLQMKFKIMSFNMIDACNATGRVNAEGSRLIEHFTHKIK